MFVPFGEERIPAIRLVSDWIVKDDKFDEKDLSAPPQKLADVPTKVQGPPSSQVQGPASSQVQLATTIIDTYSINSQEDEIIRQRASQEQENALECFHRAWKQIVKEDSSLLPLFLKRTLVQPRMSIQLVSHFVELAEQYILKHQEEQEVGLMMCEKISEKLLVHQHSHAVGNVAHIHRSLLNLLFSSMFHEQGLKRPLFQKQAAALLSNLLADSRFCSPQERREWIQRLGQLTVIVSPNIASSFALSSRFLSMHVLFPLRVHQWVADILPSTLLQLLWQVQEKIGKC